MQFKVPQNIDMADKIIGPLTMVQFLYLLVGGMIDYVLVQTVLPTQPFLFFIIGGPIAIFSLMMAFVKVNDIPFPRFLQSVILYIASPKRRIWEKSADINVPVRIEAIRKPFKSKVIKTQIEKSEIEKMASVLDTAGWAAVRDTKLKEFVEGFDEQHHTMSVPAGQTPEKAKGKD